MICVLVKKNSVPSCMTLELGMYSIVAEVNKEHHCWLLTVHYI